MAVSRPRRRLWLLPLSAAVLSTLTGCAAFTLKSGPDRYWAIPANANPETDPRAFAAFAGKADRAWAGGADRQHRNCRDCPPGTYADVQVNAVGGMIGYTPELAGARHAVVARFINRSEQTEAKYGLSGGSNPLHYLVLAPRDPAGYVRWRVWTVRGETAVAGESGSFWVCHRNKAEHKDLPPDKRAMFLDCDRSPRDVPGGGELSEILLPRTADVWLECERAGCCTASTVATPY